MKYLFLLLFTILAYPQGVKISALAEAQNITQDDLFVIVDSPGGTPVTKKITFTKVLDSIKASTLGYIILQDPFTREMDDETDRIYIPKFGNPYFAWQTDFNSGMDKIDSAVKYFDPVYFEVNGDTVTATDEWNLINTNDYPVLDSVYNHTGTASTTSSIYRAIERVNALKLNLTGGTLTGHLLFTDNTYDIGANGATRPRTGYFGTSVVAPTLNGTSDIQLNGTSINTTGTLTNVAYKGQDNSFTTTQTMTALDVTTGATTSSKLHLGTGTSVGCWITSMTDNQFALSGGCEYVSGSWTARDSYAQAINLFNGGIIFRVNTGLTAGNTFTPTQIMKINATGLKIGTTDPTEALDVTGNIKASGTVTTTQFKLSALNTAPANASDTGTTGEIRIVDGFIYICTATNTWKRVAIATW